MASKKLLTIHSIILISADLIKSISFGSIWISELPIAVLQVCYTELLSVVGGSPFLLQTTTTIAPGSKNNLYRKHDPDAISWMSQMLLVDRTFTDINVKDSTYYNRTALHYQARYGTTGSVAWLLRQDPPPQIEVRDSSNLQWIPLILAVYSNEDREGIVSLLLD